MSVLPFIFFSMIFQDYMNFKALLPYFIIGYIASLIGIVLYAIYTPESDLSPRIYIIIII